MTTKLDLALQIIEIQQKLIDGQQKQIETYEKLMSDLTTDTTNIIPMMGSRYEDNEVIIQ